MKELPFVKNIPSKGRKGFIEYLQQNPNVMEEERRKIEMEYLVPEKKSNPTKERSFSKPTTKINVETYLHKVLIYFHKKEDYLLFRKYVKVNDYIEVNTYDVKLLSSVFRAIDRGDLLINENGEIELNSLNSSKSEKKPQIKWRRKK